MEQFVKIIIEAAARKYGAAVKITIKKEGDLKIMELYDHQKEALEQTKDRNRVAYYHDM